MFKKTAFKDALIFHAVFFAIAMPVALSLQGAALGLALVVLALAYNIALPIVGHWRNHRDWPRLWLFLVPLSMTLPFADWMLVERMGTLYFPDHGIPRIGGAVPVYFMGLWIMLLWQVLWFAQLTKRPYLVTALLSFGGFLFWEWASHPMALWQANDVLKIADFALYPLIPEVLLSLGALFFWRLLKNAPRHQQVLAAFSLTIFYTGALALALLWIG